MIWYSTIICSTLLLYSITLLQSALLYYFTLPYSALLYSTLLDLVYSTLLYSTLLYSTLLYSTLLYSTATAECSCCTACELQRAMLVDVRNVDVINISMMVDPTLLLELTALPDMAMIRCLWHRFNPTACSPRDFQLSKGRNFV